MKLGDRSSHCLHAWGGWRISGYPGDEINGVIGACSGRQH
jgi:hypothetical protein